MFAPSCSHDPNDKSFVLFFSYDSEDELGPASARRRLRRLMMGEDEDRDNHEDDDEEDDYDDIIPRPRSRRRRRRRGDRHNTRHDRHNRNDRHRRHGRRSSRYDDDSRHEHELVIKNSCCDINRDAAFAAAMADAVDAQRRSDVTVQVSGDDLLRQYIRYGPPYHDNTVFFDQNNNRSASLTRLPPRTSTPLDAPTDSNSSESDSSESEAEADEKLRSVSQQNCDSTRSESEVDDVSRGSTRYSSHDEERERVEWSGKQRKREVRSSSKKVKTAKRTSVKTKSKSPKRKK